MDDVGTFDRFARIYDLLMPDADSEAVGRGLAHATRDLDRVVDLAGGSGRGLRAVAAIARIDGHELAIEGLVVDAAIGMLRRAQGHGHAVLAGDGAAIPLADDAVDAVFIVDAFHHLTERDAVLAEVARVLAPGGVVVIQEFDPTTLRGWALSRGEHLLGFDSQFESGAGLADRLERAGLNASIVEEGFSYVVAGRAPERDAQVPGV